MTREKVQEQYARILLQLEIEARAIADNPPNSKIARSSKSTIEHIGETLRTLHTEWRSHRISFAEPILPELRAYAGWDK